MSITEEGQAAILRSLIAVEAALAGEREYLDQEHELGDRITDRLEQLEQSAQHGRVLLSESHARVDATTARILALESEAEGLRAALAAAVVPDEPATAPEGAGVAS